jgi:hypothetical protein
VSKGADKGAVTVKAVLRYAETLRERAARARAADPYADPYEPSLGHARNLCTQHGPAGALRELASRARAHELRQQEGAARAARAHSELVAHQLVGAGERDAERAHMTLGERLDAALVGLELLSQTAAAPLDSDVISSSKPGHVVLLGRLDLDRERLEGDVRGLVARAERMVESTRRRLLEEEAA